MPAHLETDLGPTDVYFTHWQGGGGFGDPLLREPERVADDVERRRISPEAAAAVYGVVLGGDRNADIAATARRRADLRRERAGLGTGEALSPARAEEV